MHHSIYRLSLTYIFFAVPSSVWSECKRCACFEDRSWRSDAFLDGPKLSFSRVRRGYCSRTSPIDRETHIARVDAEPPRLYVPFVRCHPDRNRRISGITKRYALPLATPTCQVSRECVELHGVADFSCSSRLLALALASFPGSFFFLFFLF